MLLWNDWIVLERVVLLWNDWIVRLYMSHFSRLCQIYACLMWLSLQYLIMFRRTNVQVGENGST